MKTLFRPYLSQSTQVRSIRPAIGTGVFRQALNTLVLGFALIACSRAETTKTEDGAIVGGAPVNIGEFPWQVSLQEHPVFGAEPFHFCGGSILNEFWILTAAHCVDGLDHRSLRVVAGSTYVSGADSVGQVHEVLRIVSYPGYVEPSFGRDIALLRLVEPLDLTAPNVSSIPLVTEALSAELVREGIDATVSGWGTLSAGGDSPDQLYSVSVPIISSETAQTMYRRDDFYADWEITEDQLSAGIVNVGGKDACQGDSGGPMVVGNLSGLPSLPMSLTRTTAADWPHSKSYSSKALTRLRFDIC